MSADLPLSPSRVRRRFSSQAGEYDRYAIVQKQVAANLIAALPKTFEGPVLDVGTGTGELAKRLRVLYPDPPLVVSDLAHGMTSLAALNIPGAWAVDADAQELPFAAGRFAAVLSASVYQWMNDLPRAFEEGRRVLRKDGVFGFALFAERTLFELRAAHRESMREANSTHPSHVQEFPSLQQVRSALHQASFTNIQLWEADEVQ